MLAMLESGDSAWLCGVRRAGREASACLTQKARRSRGCVFSCSGRPPWCGPRELRGGQGGRQGAGTAHGRQGPAGGEAGRSVRDLKARLWGFRP